MSEFTIFPCSKPSTAPRCSERGCVWPARASGKCHEHESRPTKDDGTERTTQPSGWAAKMPVMGSE
jgi:hypothetical protein